MKSLRVSFASGYSGSRCAAFGTTAERWESFPGQVRPWDRRLPRRWRGVGVLHRPNSLPFPRSRARGSSVRRPKSMGRSSSRSGRKNAPFRWEEEKRLGEICCRNENLKGRPLVAEGRRYAHGDAREVRGRMAQEEREANGRN